MSFLRTLLILSRAPGLPTVWSNCLAGWWLGGHRNADRAPFLFVGASLLYLGSGFLNDAFDADFDKAHRQARPIPSGTVSWNMVWRAGVFLLVLGVLLLVGASLTTAALGLVLVSSIVLYHTIHKTLPFAPWLLGTARCLLYLMGATTAAHFISGWSLWCGLALAFYVTAVGFFMRWERRPASINYWPLLLLAAPMLLASIMNVGEYRQKGLLLSAVLGLWVLRALRQTYWSGERNIQATSTDLQAGIVFADWLACADGPHELSFAFLALFGATLLFQRVLPKV